MTSTPSEQTASQTKPPSSTGLSVAILATAAFVALVLSMIWAGSAPREPVPGLPDPGVLVGGLVPVATATADLAGFATIGVLIVAAVLLPSIGRDVQGLAVDAVRLARRSAWLWLVATVVMFIATAADVFAVTLGGLRGDLLVALVRDSEVGRGIALQAVAVRWVRWCWRSRFAGWSESERWSGGASSR